MTLNRRLYMWLVGPAWRIACLAYLFHWTITINTYSSARLAANSNGRSSDHKSTQLRHRISGRLWFLRVSVPVSLHTLQLPQKCPVFVFFG
ncbi:hypothetical protein BDN67DRAFT_962523 [Paxillus ammoniavirescens]|nr:hypothetical protein BDN67DRAFT_962523 [Paxillus ammoniavirescens]